MRTTQTIKKRKSKRSRGKHKTVAKKRAIANLKSYINEDGTRKKTSIELKVEKVLDSLGVYYTAEKEFFWKGKKRIFDFFVTDGLNYSFLIEADGDYYHATEYKEGIVPKSKLTKLQKKNLRNDEFKNSMAQGLGIPLLRFTETEIKRSISTVREKIKKMI